MAGRKELMTLQCVLTTELSNLNHLSREYIFPLRSICEIFSGWVGDDIVF